MRYVVTIPDDVPGSIVAVTVQDEEFTVRKLKGDRLVIVPYEEAFAESLERAEPDWRIIEIMFGPEVAEQKRAEWWRAKESTT